MTLTAILTAALMYFVKNPNIAQLAATAIASVIGSVGTIEPGRWVDVDRRKMYREVKYADGTFAHFQTKIGASVSANDDYIGSGEVIISGGLW